MDIIYDGVLQCYVAQIGDEVVCLASETYEEAHEEEKDILDMYFDPRIEETDDMMTIIQQKDNVSIRDILNQEDVYFNIDRVKDLQISAYSSDADNKKNSKFSALGIPNVDDNITNKINLKECYGYYSCTGKPEDEVLLKATIINDDILIACEEIAFMPFEKVCATEVPNQGVGVGVVEPISKIQDAYNLTRNQRIENVMLVMNRMWLMRTGSGLDPRKLVSRPGNIIPVQDLNDSIRPVETPDVTGSAYSEAQSLSTDIQTTLGTIDGTQDQNSNSFTNFATGQQIRWNEFNVRFRAMKTLLEEGISRIGEKMLRMVGQEATKDPYVLDIETEIFFMVSREIFSKNSDFYTVSVLADSTSFDSIANQRDDTLAFGQLALAYKAQGVNVDMSKVFEDIARTFNRVDYVLPPEPPQPEGGQPKQGSEKPLPENVIEQASLQEEEVDIQSQIT
jgi:hypothetical protein